MDLFQLFLKNLSINLKEEVQTLCCKTKLLIKRILFTIVILLVIWNIVDPGNDRVCLGNNAPWTVVIN